MIRIYGERNSGTNFLRSLIDLNFHLNNSSQVDTKEKVTDWKHGRIFPKKNSINIIIFRELHPWLESFYKTQWHQKKKTNIENFLTQKIELGKTQIETRTHQIANIHDRNKDIFELRYYKFNLLKKYFDNHENVVLVNYNYLLKPKNVKIFLNKLEKKFKLPRKDYINKIDRYKGGKNNSLYIKKSPNIEFQKYKELINNKVNSGIENFINNLSFKIKKSK